MRRFAIASLLAALLVWAVASATLAENALRPVPRPVELSASAKSLLQSQSSDWDSPSLTAADGVTLHAWFLRPNQQTGKCVLLLHGIADSRIGVAHHAALFLSSGYSVLMPDSRAHGESGGTQITYGVVERDDVLRWARWLREAGCTRVYGLGESLGAAILIQAAATAPAFDAIVAECPFSSLNAIAVDRVAQRMPMPPGLANLLAKPLVSGALAYTRIRYGLDLWGAAPEKAAPNLSAPLLLIHGTADTNIAPVHSERIAAAMPRASHLWRVPGAAHTAAVASAPDEFRRRVLDWFDR
jgi:uncharacterized protein